MGVQGSNDLHRVFARTTTSGVVGAQRLGQLGSEGYDTVINLLPDFSEYAIASEANIVSEQGLNYIHIPVDFAAPAGADLEAFWNPADHPVWATFISEKRARTTPRMWHCMRIETSIGTRTPPSCRRLEVTKTGPSVDRDAAKSWVTLGGRTDGT
jgi:protein tyrosine phosphatase (PTP) superfamily phosphohydrolase (DUF442 family)